MWRFFAFANAQVPSSDTRYSFSDYPLSDCAHQIGALMQTCTTNKNELLIVQFKSYSGGWTWKNNCNNSRPQPPDHQDKCLSTIIWESRKSLAELKRVSIAASGVVLPVA
jgi:hypothetical protein